MSGYRSAGRLKQVKVSSGRVRLEGVDRPTDGSMTGGPDVLVRGRVGSRGGLLVVVEATGGVVEHRVGGEDMLERRIGDVSRELSAGGRVSGW